MRRPFLRRVWRRMERPRLFVLMPFPLLLLRALQGKKDATSAGSRPVRRRFRKPSVAIAVVAFVWSMQHAFMPLTFDAKFMAYRLLAPVPFSVFQTLLYLRLRRVVPFAIAHALMDGATVLIPLLRA